MSRTPDSRDHATAAGGQPPAAVGRRRAGTALLIVGALVVAGGLVGLVWSLAAPTVSCTVTDGSCPYESYEAGVFFVGEGYFGALAVIAGVIAAVAVRREVQVVGWPVVAALAVGGVLASVVAWRVGVWLGPVDLAGPAPASGQTVELPLRLRSSGLLLVWSIASVVAALIASAGGPDLDRVERRPPDPDELAAWIHGRDQSRPTR